MQCSIRSDISDISSYSLIDGACSPVMLPRCPDSTDLPVMEESTYPLVEETRSPVTNPRLGRATQHTWASDTLHPATPPPLDPPSGALDDSSVYLEVLEDERLAFLESHKPTSFQLYWTGRLLEAKSAQSLDDGWLP